MSAYLKFFQLEKSPFDTRAQSNLVLGTKALRTAFSEIETALADGAPRICVSGKEGLGKTSLARALPKLLGDSARVVLILNPSLPWSTLRSAIVKQLDLAEGNLSRKTLMRVRAEGRRLVIAVDQAERISSESLDHLDILLGYKNDDDEQLVHCVLLANLQAAASQHNEQGEQTPLLWWLDKLNTLQLEFQPIPVTGVSSYVQKHLKRAGWKGGQIFTPDALQAIHRLTGGVPRKMSELCERALELAAEEEARGVDGGMIEDVFGEIPLEELVDDGDVTDSSYTGPRDDDAQANTATFSAEAVRSGPPRRADDAEHEADSADALDAREAHREWASRTSGAARADAGASGVGASRTPGDDPRIDRMPTPGRAVYAPVDAPISLDTFFGDSLGGERVAPAAEAPPEAERRGSADQASGCAQDETDAGFDPAPRRTGWLKWVGLAAGALLVLGGGFAALSMFGSGSTTEAPAPAVLARPKATAPSAPSAPIAGFEPIAVETPPGSESDGRAEPTMGAPAHVEHDPLLGIDAPAGDPLLGIDAPAADPLDPGVTGPAARSVAATADPAASASGASTQRPRAAATDAALASGSSREEPADAIEPTPAESPPSRASAPATPAAPASPGWQNPADAEVDAPFW